MKGQKNEEAGIDWNTNVFDVVDARFNIEGQINKIVQFYGEVVTSGAYDGGVYDDLADLGGLRTGRDNKARLSEGGINLVFLPELQLRLGKIRIPFTRDQQEDDYSYIVPTGLIYDPHGLFDYWRDGLLRLFDGGAVLHGEIAKGMLRYDLGIFNQASEDKPLQGVAWAARVEFTPTMLGFTPETKTTGRGWLHDTYLGKKGDKLTIGLSYFTQDVEVTDVLGTGVVVGGALLPDLAYLRPDLFPYTYEKELDVDGYNVDIFLEKKLGSAILNLEGAYTYFDDSHLVDKGGGVYKKEDSYYWYIQGQIMYDCVVGIGKPALYAKYEYLEADSMYQNKDYEMNRWAVGINYYIVGNAARLTVGLDNVNYDDGASKFLKEEEDLEDNITDYFVQAQIMF